MKKNFVSISCSGVIVPFVLIILLFLPNINSYLILPLNFLPVFKLNDTSPPIIMRNMALSKVYVDIEIGTPKQSIQVPLDFDSNDFYITQNAQYHFSKNPDKFSDIKFYNSNNSETCEQVEEEQYDGDNFASSLYYKDFFYFNNETDELEFYLPNDISKAESGGIGLQLWPKYEMTTSTPDDKRTFLKKIKNLNFIKDYYWSIFYNSKNYSRNDGFILLGPLPHELNKNLGYYKKSYFDHSTFRHIYADIWVDYIQYRFKFDEIYAFEGNNKEKKIINDKLLFNSSRILNVELEYNFGGVQAPNRYLEYFKDYFKEYIDREECFLDSFYISNRKYFFYCKNDKNLISKIKQTFPGFNYLNRELEFNFDLVADDLFIEKNNYVYLLMFFHNTNADDWIMGRPFLQKYQFMINPDKKDINFYANLNYNSSKEEEKEDGDSKKDDEDGDSHKDEDGDSKKDDKDGHSKKDDKNSSKDILLAVIIIGCILIIIVLGYFIWKCYFKSKYLRKIRANELEDQYEYINQKDLNQNDNLEPITQN